MTLHIDDSGPSDAPAILLLHAGVADSRVWDATIPPLRDAGYRTIRFDSRGFGRSPMSADEFSHVADALAVLDSCGVDAAHFVGLSQGAATSVDVAVVAPSRVLSLALVAPGMSGYEWPRLPGYERRVAAAEREDPAGYALEIARLWAPMSFSGSGDRIADDFACTVVTDQAPAFWADELAVDEPDPRPHLAGIAVPTLVVLGDRDLDAIAEIGRIYASGIPGARLVTLTGADHMLPLRVPGALHEELITHLGGN